MPLACFMLKRTDTVRVSFRRYRSSSAEGPACHTPTAYHNASRFVRKELYEQDSINQSGPVTDAMKADPLWPTKCEHCDYVFAPTDEWQLFREFVYLCDLGIEFTLRNAPAGAMYHAEWLDGRGKQRAPDGRNLIVKCPGGAEWWIDGGASNGPGWTRTGVPPLITCTPSIDTGNYHGFLQNGVFTDDLEGRRY